MDDDELYRAPLAEFTATRDALAARLKAAGRKQAAAELKRARRPTVPAWAANQVVWHAPESWQRLRQAAKALRRAHQKATSPDEVREATREQREALSACEARASELLAQHGHAAAPSVLEKVGHTLLALAYGAADVPPGRLQSELPPPGFEALAGLTLAPAPRAAAAPIPHPHDAEERQRAEEQEHVRRRAALKSAEARQAESRRAVVKARARLETEEQQAHALEAQLEAARRACDEARRQLEAAEAEDKAAAAEADALRQEAPAG